MHCYVQDLYFHQDVNLTGFEITDAIVKQRLNSKLPHFLLSSIYAKVSMESLFVVEIR
jgi:hypothetical protein